MLLLAYTDSVDVKRHEGDETTISVLRSLLAICKEPGCLGFCSIEVLYVRLARAVNCIKGLLVCCFDVIEEQPLHFPVLGHRTVLGPGASLESTMQVRESYAARDVHKALRWIARVRG